MATIEEAFSAALAHHQAGRLPQAEQIYRQILGATPQHADARHLLGLIVHQSGRSDLAVEMLRQAIALNPRSELYHLNLGSVFVDTGDFEQAIACFAEALRLKPDYAEAYAYLSTAYRNRGRLVEAAASCRKSLELLPGNAEAHVNLGIVFQEQGRLDEAQAQLQQALRCRPDMVAAHYNLGNVLRLAGRVAEAIVSCREAVRLAPNWSAAYSNLGAALQANQQLDEAISVFERAVELDPANFEALNNLAVVLRKSERFDRAIEVCRRAVELKPDFAPAWVNLGHARRAQGEPTEAIEAYRRAIAAEPNAAINYCLLAETLRLTGRLDEALAACHQAVAIEPGNVDGQTQLGAVCLDLKDFDAAIVSYREAVRLQSDSAESHRNLATALRHHGQFHEAIASCRRALELDPNYAPALNTLGITLQAQQRYAEAQLQFVQALRIQPDCPEARFNKALGYLAMGDLRAGWSDYEFRWQAKGLLTRPKFAEPTWDGASLPGKTILLYGEQGEGDMLQFVRYAPLVKRRVGTVLVHCNRPLAELLITCPGIDRICVTGEPVPKFDCHAPVLSLPGIFQTDLNTIPVNVPYLQPAEKLVCRWSEELPAGGPFRVGIVWQGSPQHHDDRRRSIPLEAFAPLAAIPGVQLYSLQFGAGREQLASFSASNRLIDLADRIETFQDTAAIMRNLDLVISCDSAPLHLAGALGVPVWAALPFTAEWRWMLQREDSPWYPTMRLFRQEHAGDWPGLFATMAKALANMAVGTYCHRALALRAAQRHDEARRACQQALEIEPENAAVWSQLGTAWFDLGNKPEAEACYRQVLRLAPEVAGAQRDLAVVLRAQGQFDEAIACCRRALELQPDLAAAHNTLGFCLYEQGRLTEALGEFHDCLAQQPENVNALNNLAVVERELGQFAAARASLDKALAIDPHDALAHRNRAMFWLQAGDFARGWPEYEWRSRCRKTPGDSLPQPRWDGTDFSGRVLLLYTEQGLGDVLQFVRYAPLVKQRGGTVLLECDRPLARLLTSCAGLDQTVPYGDPLPPFDLRISLMSLPGLFGTDLKTIPAAVPYLAPADELVEHWRQELGDAAGFKVGIAWQGSRLHPDDRRRSIPLEAFAPLAAISGVQLYSLQFGAGREQLPTFSASSRLIDPADRIESLEDTAAIMRNLDLVICCDSAPVHLAGALGVPVWTALAFTSDWRWLLERTDSPWYPTMRLFRQQRPGDWPGVFAAMAEELESLAASRL